MDRERHRLSFAVDDVEPTPVELPEVDGRTALEGLLDELPADGQVQRSGNPAQIEASSVDACRLIVRASRHPVLGAVILAFADHRPLVLSPDVIWLLIAQGFAHHFHAVIAKQPLWYVMDSGKLLITVRRDEFIMGSSQNDWSGVFGEFSQRIREHIGIEMHDRLLPTFSTTGSTERAAAEIVLLDTMKPLFAYELRTMCGIPSIELEGTPDDWTRLAERARDLGRFGLSWWTESLGFVLDQFAAASRGDVNREFWSSICKYCSRSGGSPVSGWITMFFPYLRPDGRSVHARLRRNAWLVKGGKRLQELLHPTLAHDDERYLYGPLTTQFPGGLAHTPFEWNYLGTIYPMEFLGGFVGVRQDAETLSLRPEIGWAVRHRRTTK